MKITISVIDKSYPPNHSFINGMLSYELPDLNNKVILLVSKGKAREKAYKYKRAICLPVLFERKHILRFFNFFLIVYYLLYLKKRYGSSNNKTSLFVRNEPVYLLACSLLNNKFHKVIYQQSFPHEQGSIFSVKKQVAKLFILISRKKVDGLITVSPLGLKRLKKYFPNNIDTIYIPLLSYETERLNSITDIRLLNDNDNIRFIYIGSHGRKRKLNIVLEGIYKAYKNGVNAIYDFIGGSKDDINRLRRYDFVIELEKNNIINFIERIPRKQLLKQMSDYDIGLSLIPPSKIYEESSPTKLVEYMSYGQAVLATRGIPLQVKFVKESNGGILVNWDVDDIFEKLVFLSDNFQLVNKMKKRSYVYSFEKLSYSNYLNEIKDILWIKN